MKMILAGVVLAALLAAPVLARSQRNEGPVSSEVYLKQGTQSRVGEPGLYLPTPDPDPTEQWPCSTAPDFCPDYHGDNGG